MFHQGSHLIKPRAFTKTGSGHRPEMLTEAIDFAQSGLPFDPRWGGMCNANVSPLFVEAINSRSCCQDKLRTAIRNHSNTTYAGGNSSMGMASLRRDGFTSVEAVMTGEPGAYSPQLSAVPTIMFLSMILSKRRVYPCIQAQDRQQHETARTDYESATCQAC